MMPRLRQQVPCKCLQPHTPWCWLGNGADISTPGAACCCCCCCCSGATRDSTAGVGAGALAGCTCPAAACCCPVSSAGDSPDRAAAAPQQAACSGKHTHTCASSRRARQRSCSRLCRRAAGRDAHEHRQRRGARPAVAAVATRRRSFRDVRHALSGSCAAQRVLIQALRDSENAGCEFEQSSQLPQLEGHLTCHACCLLELAAGSRRRLPGA